jgi:hypothetical protein
MKWISFLFLALFQNVEAQEIRTDTIWMENTAVRLQHIIYGKNAKTVFVNLHENESTSIEASRKIIENSNGYLISVQQNGDRNIRFDMKGTTYVADPNRIFSKKGRIATLKNLGKYIPAAEKEVKLLADAIIGKLYDAKLVIALHNNTPGPGLTIRSYVGGKGKTYINPSMDEDDFVLTTDTKIFNKLKTSKINAVWISHKTEADDGSLSIYCSKKKIPYINVEAEHGHTAEQERMLNALTEIINQYNK